MNRFTEQISLAKMGGSLIKWLDRMRKAKLIILDDFGLQPISHDAIMDRIIPKAHRIELKGASLRTKSKYIS